MRGGYYTPEPVARFLAAWAIRSRSEAVLEPTCGDGNIVVEVARRLESLGAADPQLLAFELDEHEAAKACARLRSVALSQVAIVETREFFEAARALKQTGRTFGAVVGNPPFVRYQDFPDSQRERAFHLMREMGLHPTRLANAWLPFLAVSIALLNDTGRLAMVIPAELFQVGYAGELRQFLSSTFRQIHIVTFKKLIFPEIQQEVVLLLADRSPHARKGIQVHEITDQDELVHLRLEEGDKLLKPIDHSAEKWTKYFLETEEIVMLRQARLRQDIELVGDFVSIDVGVVTGDNDYFLVTPETAHRYRLQDELVPIVGRSTALPGVQFNPSDLGRWARDGKPAALFLPRLPLSDRAEAYVSEGARRGVPSGYKCRIRKDWFVVPSVWRPDLFFLRQADLAPRFVVNDTRATCTDTLHRGRLLNGLPARSVAVAFMNSLTLAASEVTGRSYGGGVMTYEPTEVERLPLPVKAARSIDIAEVDDLIRNRQLEAALDLVDRAVLERGLGYSKGDIAAFRGIWKKLSARRRARKRASKASEQRGKAGQLPQ